MSRTSYVGIVTDNSGGREISTLPAEKTYSRRHLIAAGIGVSAAVLTGFAAWQMHAANSSGRFTMLSKPSSDPNRPVDDVPSSIELLAKGAAIHPPPAWRNEVTLGVGVLLRNRTPTPIKANIVYTVLDRTGRAIVNEEFAITEPILGEVLIPGNGQVGVGDMVSAPLSMAETVADIAIWVILPQGSAQDSPLSGRVTELQFNQTGEMALDNVAFEAVNTFGLDIREPDYSLLYRNSKGDIVGGFLADRTFWKDIPIPADEADRYQPGTTKHRLPVLLAPGLRSQDVSIFLWPA